MTKDEILEAIATALDIESGDIKVIKSDDMSIRLDIDVDIDDADEEDDDLEDDDGEEGE